MALWSLVLVLAVVAAVLGASRIIRRTTVFEYQTALEFSGGRFRQVLAAGAHWHLLPWSRVVVLDARPRLVTVAGQEILTRDNVSVKISLATVFQLTDGRAAVLGVENYEQALYAHLQNALREFVGSLSIEELVARRSEIAAAVHEAVREAAGGIGLAVRSVAVKDIMFPGSLRDAFAQVTKARQDGLAALERARGESAAVRSLANTARIVQDNPYLLQLRLLQSIAESKAGTLVVNVPTPPPPPTAPSGENESRSSS